MANTPNLMTRVVTSRPRLEEFLSLAGMAGPVVLVIVNLTVALLTPGYSFIRDSISSLAWTPLGWLQTIGFVVIGLFTELSVADLFFSIRGIRGFRIGVALIMLLGLGLILIGIFHADPAHAPHTVEGEIHGLTAKAIFLLFPAASLLIAPSLPKYSLWKPFFIYSLVAAIVAIGLLLSTVWIPEESTFGLFERALVVDEILWLEIVAIWLFRVSLRMGPLKFGRRQSKR